MNVKDNLKEIDRELCFKEFDNFKILHDKEINRLQLMNCYSKAKIYSLVWNIRNYAKKLNKFDSLPVFCQVSYAEGSDKKWVYVSAKDWLKKQIGLMEVTFGNVWIVVKNTIMNTLKVYLRRTNAN